MTGFTKRYQVLVILILFLETVLKCVGSLAELQGHISESNDITNEDIQVLNRVSRPQMCSGFGAQPCTCYYPDHPSVTLFQLDADEITVNAARVNGTGPESCEHLQSIGHSLEGFYMVRFKPNRVKAIFCGFKQTLENFSNKSQVVAKSSWKQIRDPGSSEIIRFCNGLGDQPCTFLYPDHPDVPLLHLKRNESANSNSSCENCILGPTSCDDLRLIGHKLRGFYIIRLNALKVKIIYCNFNQVIANVGELIRAKNRNEVKRVCRDVGSQPCSCYHSKFRDILQFEMGSDEITRSAMDKNGAGPATCEELRDIGYTLNGFFMLRFTSTTIKMAYCNLKNLEIKKEKNESSIIEPSLLASTTVTPILSATTRKKKEKCNPAQKIYHVKNEAVQGFCLETTTQSNLSLSGCDDVLLKQQWVYIPMPSGSGHFICMAFGKKCITVTTPVFSLINYQKPELIMKELNYESREQKWVLDDVTGQLRNVYYYNGLVLAMYSNSVENPASIGSKWKFELNLFLEKPPKTQKWSFVQVRNNSNVTLCDHEELEP